MYIVQNQTNDNCHPVILFIISWHESSDRKTDVKANILRTKLRTFFSTQINCSSAARENFE